MQQTTELKNDESENKEVAKDIVECGEKIESVLLEKMNNNISTRNAKLFIRSCEETIKIYPSKSTVIL